MHAYRALADMLAQHRKNNKARTSLEAPSEGSSAHEHDGEEDKTVVLPSSTELFYFYAQSLEQCARLSTGKALFDFGVMCAKWLRIYAGIVLFFGSILFPLLTVQTEEVLIASMKR
jgi:vacuolar protein sorting-associated protein 53